MSRADRLAGIVADGLNEYAAVAAEGRQLERHAPSSPLFWFYSLAREQAPLCRSKRFREMLTREARGYLNAKPSLWGRSRVRLVGGVWRLPAGAAS